MGSGSKRDLARRVPSVRCSRQTRVAGAIRLMCCADLRRDGPGAKSWQSTVGGRLVLTSAERNLDPQFQYLVKFSAIPPTFHRMPFLVNNLRLTVSKIRAANTDCQLTNCKLPPLPESHCWLLHRDALTTCWVLLAVAG